MQIAGFGFDPGAIIVGRGQALPTTHRDITAQRCQFGDHLIDQRIQIHPLKVQRRRTLLQPRIGQHLVHQLVEVLNIAVHAQHVFAACLFVAGVTDHLQAKAQARHWGAQFMGHRPHQFTLHGQRTL